MGKAYDKLFSTRSLTLTIDELAPLIQASIDELRTEIALSQPAKAFPKKRK